MHFRHFPGNQSQRSLLRSTTPQHAIALGRGSVWACRRKGDGDTTKICAPSAPRVLASPSFNVPRSTHNASLRHTCLQVVGRRTRDAHADAHVVLAAICLHGVDGTVVGTGVVVVRTGQRAMPIEAVRGVRIHGVAAVSVFHRIARSMPITNRVGTARRLMNPKPRYTPEPSIVERVGFDDRLPRGMLSAVLRLQRDP